VAFSKLTHSPSDLFTNEPEERVPEYVTRSEGSTGRHRSNVTENAGVSLELLNHIVKLSTYKLALHGLFFL
jgi:hypothetical protein